jgi:hypothetical protein
MIAFEAQVKYCPVRVILDIGARGAAANRSGSEAKG